MKTPDETKTKTKTILLVDDEDYLVIFLEKLLAREGYTVVTASNGKQAIDVYMAQKDKIDLVLMDIAMPILDGLEAHRELKLYDPDVPILLMSSYSQESFDDLNHPHFIRKPMLPSDLFSSIKRTIEESVAPSFVGG